MPGMVKATGSTVQMILAKVCKTIFSGESTECSQEEAPLSQENSEWFFALTNYHDAASELIGFLSGDRAHTNHVGE